MGRTLRRVPLDFSWPLDKVWEGYINPIVPKDCKQCGGSGNSSQVQYLYDRWYGKHRQDWVWCDASHTIRWNRAAWDHNLDEEDIAVLLEHDRLWDFTRRPRNEKQRADVEKKIAEGGNSWLPYNNGYIPTPEEVNAWSRNGFGHDSINAYYVVKAKAEKLGYPLACDICHGEGVIWNSPRQKAEYDSWKAYDPPTGEGYQLWETVTEGSPQSPVFTTLEDLCEWCEIFATTFASHRATAEEWYSMLNEGFVHHTEGNMTFL